MFCSSTESRLSELHARAEAAEGKVRLEPSRHCAAASLTGDLQKHEPLVSFRKFIQDSDEEEEAVEEEERAQLLTRRVKSQEEKVRRWKLLLLWK